MREVAGRWGDVQVLVGPVLAVPFREAFKGPEGVPRTTLGTLYVLPDRLAVSGTLEPSVRRRGIYEVVLFSTELSVEGVVSRPEVDAFGFAPEKVLRSDAPDLDAIRPAVHASASGLNFFQPADHDVQTERALKYAALFFLLLVALSEHVGFAFAYLASAAATIGLVGGYGRSVLGTPARAAAVAGVLAAAMYLTRRVDWYAVGLPRSDSTPSPNHS